MTGLMMAFLSARERKHLPGNVLGRRGMYKRYDFKKAKARRKIARNSRRINKK